MNQSRPYYIHQTEEVFRNIEDGRPEQLKARHHQIVKDLYRRNLQNMKIIITQKEKTEYQPAKLIREDLGDGWFIHISDNNNLSASRTIITMHGCPGDHREWAGLETQVASYRSVRWINVVVPGFDGVDERRGTYPGTYEGLAHMIIRLLKKKNIPKFIFCGHSMGGIFSTYFMTHYPQYVQGSLNITGNVDTWYVGLLTFYNLAVVSNGLNLPGVDVVQVLKSDQNRKKAHEKMTQMGSEVHFSGVKFPNLRVPEVCAYIKLIATAPKGLSTIFEYHRQIRSLRVYLFGQSDPIQQNAKTEEMMVNKCFGKFDQKKTLGYKYNLTEKQKQQLIKNLEAKHPGVKLDLENVQTNFVFNFEETGHNVHRRRPKEAAKILDLYLHVLDVAPLPHLNSSC